MSVEIFDALEHGLVVGVMLMAAVGVVLGLVVMPVALASRWVHRKQERTR